MNQLSILLHHLKNGTILDRLINNKKHKLFREYSIFLKSGKNYIEKKISDKLIIRLFKNANLSQELYCYGFEESEVIFFKKYLSSGDTVIDVGANIGLFTLIASEKVFPNGKVYSFEPSPQTFKWLSENIQANSLSNISAHKTALSDREGIIDFYISSKGFDAFNSIIKPSKGDGYVKESVPTLTLDAFIKNENLEGKVNLIKIDVEGFEIPLICGATNLLSSSQAPNLIIEFTESNAKNANTTCAELYNKIISFGYTLYQYNAKRNALILEPAGKSYLSYKNLIATKNIDAINKRLNRK